MLSTIIKTKNLSTTEIALILAGVIILSLVLSIAFAIFSLWIINICWDNPEWASITPKHVAGLSILIFLSSFVFKNSKKD